MAEMEIKKMKQGMSYSCKEKTIILNVFKYLHNQYPDKCVTDLVRRTAKATGCSEKSIFQFRKEEASAEGFKEPSKTKIRKNININSRDNKYDQGVRQAIRNVIYDLKYRNIVPSLNTILKQVNSDDSLPNFSLMTLRRLMFDMGFYYEKNGNKSILSEKSVVNKDNMPAKQNKKAPSKSPRNNNNLNLESREVKPPVAPVQQQNVYAPPNHHPHMNYQHHNQRIMPMHVTMQDAHMMGPMHAPTPHSMPMMLNHRRDLVPPPGTHPMAPPHMKQDLPPWMHSHNMIKQH